MGATATRHLQARAFRDSGTWWTIEIPELTSAGPNGTVITAIGGAISLRGIQRAATELAAAWLDVDRSNVVVEVQISPPADVAQLWRDGADAEAEARAAVQRAAMKRRDAVHALRADGYTLEATAAALGISTQRAAQLAQKRPAESTP